MRIGIALPQYGTHAHPTRIADFARDAEAAGFDSFWVNDRALTPVEPDDVYPMPGYTPENPYPPEYTTYLDPLTVLTVAATATTRARLGTSVLNATWYPPLLLARTLTTLDRLSGGRLDVGLGIGWMRDEAAALNTDFGKRGAHLDEILDILRGIWTENPFAHEGPNWRIPRAHVDLRPAQRPHPPVLLGGFSPAALRRVGRRADGWAGVAMSPSRHAAVWAVARRAAEEAGRDPAALRQEIRFFPEPGATPESIAAALSTVRATGADGCFFDLQQTVREPTEALGLGIRALERYRAGG
ncbi:TIGR03619 family F420-dependent LLM class oxidoreductase [Streptomyces sp. UNOC14_S4]|uniref:TIGR03619 family F420-dependent LLM class oxidoreductase n=1 Tax=Streptomyces sp. UNOC14_S4 TaxID=2872340 RepID=UPI001E47D457|nr:TIGR03619 family F420-dependent LLM class oxidoreductase [Streptomyces sp. UNOC14_S4]MCC3768892.1 TIGR03619 family F420-dependent LLM class oxidoreductase [Streptomyces sp. UNOC14_S4]